MENIAIPIDLSAFALSPSCCDGPSKIGPITQPDYIGLRLDDSLILHDVVDPVDFHLTSPASNNVRLTDIGANPPALRQNRLGVYLHWSLPRVYRSAAIYTDQAEKQPPPTTKDPSQPVYRSVPNRFLIVRRLSAQQPAGKLPDFQTWVVESDRLRKINDIPESVDLEVDVTPFVRYKGQADAPGLLDTQAEIFLGQRNEHSGWQDQSKGWSEDTSTNATFRDGLTIMDSGNPLFPDYTPHNGSVFSIVDSFIYRDAGASADKHLSSATADYFVVGWHSKTQQGPLAATGAEDLRSRLADIFLQTDPRPTADADTSSDPKLAAIQAMLNSNAVTNVLVYGGIYDVVYDVNGKPASLADMAAEKFAQPNNMEPLSIGTTPLDAVLSFLDAHKGNIEQIFGASTANVTSEILSMASLLYAADDTYDSRVRAQDLLFTNNWAGSQGGTQWKFAGQSPPGKPPAVPTDNQLNALAELNELQAQYNSLTNQMRSKLWDLFAEWWKWVSDRTNISAEKGVLDVYTKTATSLKGAIRAMQTTAASLKQQIDTQSKAVPCKGVPLPSFFTKKDPTLSIAGLDSGWPVDFLSVATAQFSSQLQDPTTVPQFSNIFGTLSNPVTTDGKLRDAADRALAACLLRSGSKDATLFTKGFKQWGNQNPFAPMFVEWQALYYHVDRSKWDVGVRNAPTGIASSEVRFTPNEALYNDKSLQKDYRWLSGRVLILPQPVFTLSTLVNSVLSNTPNVNLTAAQQKDISDNISKLKFISCPLDGLTHHLITRYKGTHVSPNIRVQGQPLVPLGDAVTAAQPIGLNADDIRLIDSESSTTPYGNLMAFDPDAYPGVPFKGVTHGQMMLTHCNIIDKFGQAVCVPQWRPTPRVQNMPPPALYPCLSDYLSPDLTPSADGTTGVLNTIFAEPSQPKGQWPLSRFIQLTPSINQDARINAVFLTPNNSTSYPFWHETVDDKPESPIFGWIVVNYQDYGLQFFLSDGTFYREVRVGGPSNINTGSKWLPFDPPANQNTGSAQLDQLIAKLSDPQDPQAVYAFTDMINAAIKTMPSPPSDYSAYANSLVGKPLALVNVGWSLELAAPALQAQNTLGNLPADVDSEMWSYDCPVKIGDAYRTFDGVVGFFRSDNKTNGTTDWSKMLTYFTSTAASQNIKTVQISPSNFPILKPTYIDATDPNFTVKGISKDVPGPNKYKSYIEARTAQYVITTMLIDPYTPLHAYSPMLPITSLKLPPWTVQAAFKRMTAFFRMGPNLLSSDVPTQYDATRPLDATTWLQAQNVANPTSTDLPPTTSSSGAVSTAPPALPSAPAAASASTPTPAPAPGATASTSATNTQTPSIRLPISGKKGLWQWLQPYDVAPSPPASASTGATGTSAAATPNVTRFNALGVGQEDTAIRNDPAPYTFVEGYLQLARPLLSSDVSSGSGTGGS